MGSVRRYGLVDNYISIAEVDLHVAWPTSGLQHGSPQSQLLGEMIISQIE